MKKLLPESIYNTPAIEAWLSDQARRGRWVRRFSGYKAVFQEGAPGECRFRLEPRMDRPETPDGETLALYNDMGWEYVTSYGGELYLWRAARPDARELHTDPVAQGMAFDGLVRILKRRMWVYGALDVLMAGLLLYVLLIRPAGVLSAAQNGLTTLPVNLFVILWNSGMLVSDFHTLRALRRTLGAGIAPERAVPRNRRRAVWTVYWIAAVLLLGMSLREIWYHGEDISALTPDMPVVSLNDLGVDGAVSCDGSRWKNAVASGYIRCWQDTDAKRSPDLQTDVCDLRLGLLGGRLLDGHVEHIRRWGGQEPRALEGVRFDELYYLQSGERQYLAARRGTRVLYMEGYRLPEDLTGHLDGIAASLAKDRQ